MKGMLYDESVRGMNVRFHILDIDFMEESGQLHNVF